METLDMQFNQKILIFWWIAKQKENVWIYSFFVYKS